MQGRVKNRGQQLKEQLCSLGKVLVSVGASLSCVLPLPSWSLGLHVLLPEVGTPLRCRAAPVGWEVLGK